MTMPSAVSDDARIDDVDDDVPDLALNTNAMTTTTQIKSETRSEGPLASFDLNSLQPWLQYQDLALTLGVSCGRSTAS